MHAGHRAIETRADLRDGKRGGVGRKQAIRLADLGELLKGLLFNLHVLDGCLDDQVAILADFLGAGVNAAENLVHLFLRELALRNASRKTLLDSLLSALCECICQIAEANFVPLYLRKRLRDAATHGAGADDAYLHAVPSSVRFADYGQSLNNTTITNALFPDTAANFLCEFLIAVFQALQRFWKLTPFFFSRKACIPVF